MLNSTDNAEREALLETARDFGAREAYRRFPMWSDDLEHRIKADWEAVFGPDGWLEVRHVVKEGWDEMHQIVAPGEPLVHQH
jgi:hypothetical protein